MPSGRQGLREVLAQAGQSRLGRGVGDELRRLPFGGVGGDVHDAGEAAVLVGSRAQQRQGGAYAADGAERADVEGGLPLLVIDGVEAADPDLHRAGGVDEHVQRAPSIGDRARRRRRSPRHRSGRPAARGCPPRPARGSARASRRWPPDLGRGHPTLAPSAAKASAAARPMPLEPPETTTAAFASPRSIERDSYQARCPGAHFDGPPRGSGTVVSPTRGGAAR